MWMSFHEMLVVNAKAYGNPTGHQSLLLVGDSITEAYRNTAMGEATERTAGINVSLAPLARAFPPPPLILAISGDETQHLLWRLQTELSLSLRTDAHLHISLLIGTNNIGNAGHKAAPTAAGVLAVARYLLAHTRGKVLVHAILPRGAPPPKPRRRTPKYVSLMDPVREVNALVARAVETELAAAFPGRVHRVDCGPLFHSANPSAEVNYALMTDGLHPNVAGSRLLAECTRDAFARWRREEAAHVHSAPGRAPLQDHVVNR